MAVAGRPVAVAELGAGAAAAATCAAAIGAHAAYAEGELAALLGEAPTGRGRSARRAAGLASNNLETTPVARAAGAAAVERGASCRPRWWPTRRCAASPAGWRRCSTRRAWPDRRRLADWRDWLARAFEALGGAPLPASRRRPTPMGALARIARQIELIDGALRDRRATAPPAAPSPPSAAMSRNTLPPSRARRAGRTARSAPPVGAEKPSDGEQRLRQPGPRRRQRAQHQHARQMLAGEGHGMQQLDAPPAAAPTSVSAMTVQRSRQARGRDRGQPRRAEPFDQPRGPRRTGRSRRRCPRRSAGRSPRR